MSIVEPDRSPTKKFLTVVCPCGRSLRAAIDMAGQEISCWECHRMVRVPVVRYPERTYRVVRENLTHIVEGPWLAAVFLAAAAVTGVLCVPRIGVPLSTIVLVLCALGYGEVIRQCGIDTWDFDDWLNPINLLQRVGAAVLFGLALAAPMLLAPGGYSHAPRFTTLSLLVGLAAAMLLPVLMFLTFARDERGPLGWRRGAQVLAYYPVATCLALLLIPIGMVCAEFLVVMLASWNNHFSHLILELFPGSDYFAEQYKIPKYGNYTRTAFLDSRFAHLYLRRLHQGFALAWALPAQLSIKTVIMASPWTLELTDMDYLRIRAIYTQIAAMVCFLFMGIQSLWLGAISTLESKPFSKPLP